MMDVSDVAAEEMSKYAMIKRPGSSQTWQWLVAVAAPQYECNGSVTHE